MYPIQVQIIFAAWSLLCFTVPRCPSVRFHPPPPPATALQSYGGVRLYCKEFGKARGSKGVKNTDGAQPVIHAPTFFPGRKVKVPSQKNEETERRHAGGATRQGSYRLGQLLLSELRPGHGSHAGPVDTDAQGGRLPGGTGSEEALLTGELQQHICTMSKPAVVCYILSWRCGLVSVSE